MRATLIKTMLTNSEPRIKAVETTFRIVSGIVELQGANTSEISRYLDLPMSTAFEHLETLEGLGYIVRREGQYHLSTKFIKRGAESLNSYSIYHISEEELRNLAKKTGELTSLMIEENGYGVYLYTDDSENSLDAVVLPGNRSMLHVSAPGKAILAHLAADKRNKILKAQGLPKVTQNTITDMETLHDELEEIRDVGYAIDDEEGVRGLQGIGAPILSQESDEILGAISIYRPADQNIETLVEETVNPLSQSKNTIEITYTYHK